jgi:cell division septation protein DedD
MHTARLVGVAALCALAVLTATLAPAAADPPRRRSLAQCTAFEQREKDEVSVELTVRNTCTVPINCRVSWRLVCAPESKKRRKVTPGSVAFTLAEASAQVTEASAAECGDASWMIKDVIWRCDSSKE